MDELVKGGPEGAADAPETEPELPSDDEADAAQNPVPAEGRPEGEERRRNQARAHGIPEQERRALGRRIRMTCRAIMLAATAIGLLMLAGAIAASHAGNMALARPLWHFWVTWPAAVVACAVYSHVKWSSMRSRAAEAGAGPNEGA